MTLPVPSLTGSENDHKFRSHFIQWLLHQPSSLIKDETINQKKIPRVLVQYWDDKNNIPTDVKECLNSWEVLCDYGFQRHLFDDQSARDFIRNHFSEIHVKAFDLCYHPAMRCDYFRLCYIHKFGGFYVDADEVYQGTECDTFFHDNKLKIQPLCYDIATDSMVESEEFLKDTTFPSNRIFYVNNNPIIAPPNHALIRLAIERSTSTLLLDLNQPEIQSTTGPGNLSASLVRHSIETKKEESEFDFLILQNWEHISVCRWELDYRKDERNWRLLKRN